MTPQLHRKLLRWPAAALTVVFSTVLLFSPACALACGPWAAPEEAPSSAAHHHSDPAPAPEPPCGSNSHPDFVAKAPTALVFLSNTDSLFSVAAMVTADQSPVALRNFSWFSTNSTRSLLKVPVFPQHAILRI